MRRLRKFGVFGLLLLGGCVNTQAAIAPATLGDLWLGIEADVETWITFLLMLF